MKPTPDQIVRLKSMNLAHRFHDQGPTHKEDLVSGRPVIDRDKPGPCVVCDIFDITTGQQFFSAKGGTEAEAFEKAMAGAIDAPKPLTPAQLADPRFAKMSEDSGKLQKELDALKAVAEKAKAIAPEAFAAAEAEVSSEAEKARSDKAARRAAKAAKTTA